jgi:hypothetical protein
MVRAKFGDDGELALSGWQIIEQAMGLVRLIERRKGRLLSVDHLPERGKALSENLLPVRP